MSDSLSSSKEVSFYPGYNTLPYFCNNLILVRIIQITDLYDSNYVLLLVVAGRRKKNTHNSLYPLKLAQSSRI